MCIKGNNSKYTKNYIDIQFKSDSNLHQVLDIRIKFVNDLRQVFLLVLRFLPPLILTATK